MYPWLWMSLSLADPLVSPDGIVMKPCGEEKEGMVCIPGGAFLRGSEEEHRCEQSENRRNQTRFGPEQVVWVQTFYMDKTEVTYGAYKACQKSKECPPANPSYGDFSRPNQPMMGANWYAAKKYCEAQGKILPSEAQWEKAARGPDGNEGPYGNQLVTCENAVIKDQTGRSCGVKKRGNQPSKGRVWEVAKKPAGAYGLYDMVGNAEEWVADWYVPSFEECGEACLGTDPKGPCEGADKCPKMKLKIVKGGSWYWGASHAKGWHRRPHFPSNKPYHHFGFRCAATIDQVKALTSSEK